MVTLLFTSVFIFGILAVALYFWQKPAPNRDQATLPPIQPARGLFSDPETALAVAPPKTADETAKQRSVLLEKARSGDKSVLEEAHDFGDQEFYSQILNLLVAAVASDAALLSLMSYVARQELPVNSNLVQAVLDSWKRSPDRNSTAKALHITALADDAELYRRAIEAALQYWQSGKLADVSPVELQALFEGEYWVLSARTRGSGSGFILKRTLADARRELGNTAGINQ